jgi:hypothetical protein
MSRIEIARREIEKSLWQNNLLSAIVEDKHYNVDQFLVEELSLLHYFDAIGKPIPKASIETIMDVVNRAYKKEDSLINIVFPDFADQENMRTYLIHHSIPSNPERLEIEDVYKQFVGDYDSLMYFFGLCYKIGIGIFAPKYFENCLEFEWNKYKKKSLSAYYHKRLPNFYPQTRPKKIDDPDLERLINQLEALRNKHFSIQEHVFDGTDFEDPMTTPADWYTLHTSKSEFYLGYGGNEDDNFYLYSTVVYPDNYGKSVKTPDGDKVVIDYGEPQVFLMTNKEWFAECVSLLEIFWKDLWQTLCR